MPHEVFISYAHEDRVVAETVCAAVERNGLLCWMAPRDVPPGNWGASIIRAIENSRAVVLVFSSSSNRSTQVHREIERAVNRRLIIVPLRIEDVPLSKEMEYYISSQQWHDAVTPPVDQHAADVARKLKVLLAPAPEDAAPARRPLEPGGSKSRLSLANVWHVVRSHLAFIAVPICLFQIFEAWLKHTDLGHRLQDLSFEWMQSFVPEAAAATLPVAIVDSSDIKRVSIPGRKEEFTSRESLNSVLSQLAKEAPSAIGFDLDFSPEEDGFIAPGTFEFFESCSQSWQRTKVPVFLGVHRSESLGPAAWLGSDAYQHLAAGISRPAGLVTQMPLETHFRRGEKPLPGLGRALALAHGTSPNRRPLPWWLRWLTQSVQTIRPVEELENFVTTEFLVNFKALSALTNVIVQPADISSSSGLLRNRMVLVGDATRGKSSDPARVPNEPEFVPGVFVHACAAYTLVNAPLYETRHWVLTLLNVALSMAGAVLVHALVERYGKQMPVTTIPLSFFMALLLFLLLIVFACWLAAHYRVITLELLVVLGVLVIQCPVELTLQSINWPRLRNVFGKTAEAFVAADGH